MSAAVYMRSADNLRDTMPQTVPSPRGNPCEFGDFAADAFDLSLLPSPTFGLAGSSCSASTASAGAWGALAADCEVPFSPTSVGQLMSLFYDAPPLAGKDEPLLKKVKLEPDADTSCSWEEQRAFVFPSVKQEALQDASVPQMGEGDARPDAGDHQLLREVLKDTSFQRKFNLKPFDLQQMAAAPWAAPLRRTLSGGGGGQDEDLQQLDQDAIEPMISLAIQQMRNEIGNTCSMLGIAPDPALWTREDVRAWIMWTVRQFSLPSVQLNLFDMEGATLASLSELDLTQRAPQSGSLLFAQLEIWKAACAEEVDLMDTAPASPPRASPPPAAPLLHQLEVPPPGLAAPAPASNALLCPPPLEQGACSPQSQHNSSASSADTSDDEDEDCDAASMGAAAAAPGSATSSSASSPRGSHIHLWQFLKELLSAPQLHGSCVRWVDRPGGVFKIEDSVRVARLWGARKNRPAMNYDKLSRSIRQYYKKGIMKKTERSQRLVYQFCHPYSL